VVPVSQVREAITSGGRAWGTQHIMELESWVYFVLECGSRKIISIFSDWQEKRNLKCNK
jgi:hypothetical protein